MKPLIVFSDVTVDGFMAGPDNDLDFMVDDPQLEDELTGMLMSVADTIVVGRKAFPDLRPSHATERSLGVILTALRGRSMQYRASALPRIYLSPKVGDEVAGGSNRPLRCHPGEAPRLSRSCSWSGRRGVWSRPCRSLPRNLCNPRRRCRARR